VSAQSSSAQPSSAESSTRSFAIRPRGPFSLAESATFGFAQRDDGHFEGVMRLAFGQDGYEHHAGVELRQDADGTVHAVVHGGGPDLAAVQRQVERSLSLDHDGEQFLAVGQRDPVIGRLQAAAPGLRPPLFYSPYEAAAWSVLSARRPAAQMRQVRDRLGQAHGASFDLAGQQLAAFPAPAALLAVESFPGLPPEKIERLHGVARAALDGVLDPGRLLALGPERAAEEVQAIKGIGPFYSELIVIRATGFADVLPTSEPKALALAGDLYGLGGPATPARLRELAEPWRPFRTWATVLIRAVTPRLPGAAEQEAGPRRLRLRALARLGEMAGRGDFDEFVGDKSAYRRPAGD
jgi:DNA-3-methyladenine glycosylase II